MWIVVSVPFIEDETAYRASDINNLQFFYGPFRSDYAAYDWAEQNFNSSNWTVSYVTLVE